MSVFTREWVSSTDLSCFTDHTYIGGRSYSSTTDNLLDFCTKKKLSSIYRHELIVINCALISWWNIKRCLQFSRNSNFQLSLLLVFHFSVVIQSGEFLASVWQEEGNLEVLKRCYIQIYPTIVFFLCQGKAFILFNICETWSEKCGALVKEAADHKLISDK